MSSRTRYFLIGSSLVVVVGLCTGLVAYYNGSAPAGAAARLPDLAYLPADASAVAYADVKDIMASEFRQRLREALPTGAEKDRFLAETGIDIEHDIDSVLAGLNRDARDPRNAVILFRGRFDTAHIEALAAEHGAVTEQYKGKKILLAPQTISASPAGPSSAIAFLEPGLLAIGSQADLHAAIDAPSAPGSITANAQLMDLVAGAQQSGNAWMVGRFDAMAMQPNMPVQIRSQMPAVEWFAVSADIDRGVRGTVRAETRDEQGADQLRSVVNGGLSAARMFAGNDARVTQVLNGLQATGTGTTVQITFALGPETLDMLKGAMAQTPLVPPAIAK
ncbi:MAG: hypothetical protein ABI634_09525 [Acidobacteriota bacterium]